MYFKYLCIYTDYTYKNVELTQKYETNPILKNFSERNECNERI